ncbi:hypothetical protein [Alicyclobacillus macrosporangiidus]|uniref:hypothetical protein n=1 Tax=Alicyclobacillus macrosporangiidus TaxID=392015 RepID=UPI00049864F1|nr:hypothetical protein [Alicyclobacillus macrosporangiidus]
MRGHLKSTIGCSLVMAAVLIPSAAVYADSPGLVINDQTATMDVAVRSNVPGSNQTVFPTKTNPGSADPSALESLRGTASFGKLKQDFQAGKVITIVGNDDGKLSDMLLRQAFDAPGPVFETVNKDNPNFHPIAEAIVRVPGSTSSMIFRVFGDKSLPVSDITATIQEQYTQALASLQQYQKTQKTQGAKLGPDSTPSGSGNNYYYSSSAAYVYDSRGYKVGKYIWGYQLTREYHDSSYSVWDIKRLDQITPGYVLAGSFNYVNGYDGGEVSATWESIGVHLPGADQNTTYGGEQLISFSPTQTQNYSSVTVSLVGGGIDAISWTYQGHGALITNDSNAGVYGAWNTGFQPLGNFGYWQSTDGAAQAQYYEPGVRAQNTFGRFYGSGDFVVTFCGLDATNYSSGDIGDSFNVADF